MGRYIIRRLIVALPTLFVVTVVVTGLLAATLRHPVDCVLHPGGMCPSGSD